MLRRALKNGFTLVEVIAAVAVISILAAALVPNLAAYQQRKDVETTVTIVQDIETSLAAMKAATSLLRYPFRLSHLGSPIRGSGTNNVNADTTSCSGVGGPSVTSTTVTTYTTAQASAWTGAPTGGPYFHRTIPFTGFPTPIGTLSDTVYRAGANNGTGPLIMWIRNVTYEEADEFNLIFEGDADNVDRSNTTGNIRFGVPSGINLVDLQIRMTAVNSC